MYGLAVSYSQSVTIPESVYVGVSSARVKVQDGRKEKKKQTNTKYQDRVKLKKFQCRVG